MSDLSAVDFAFLRRKRRNLRASEVPLVTIKASGAYEVDLSRDQKPRHYIVSEAHLSVAWRGSNVGVSKNALEHLSSYLGANPSPEVATYHGVVHDSVLVCVDYAHLWTTGARTTDSNIYSSYVVLPKNTQACKMARQEQLDWKEDKHDCWISLHVECARLRCHEMGA